MSNRTSAIGIVIAASSCVRTPPSVDVGDAKTSTPITAQSAVPAQSRPPPPERTWLAIEDVGARPVLVQALDAIEQREATAVRSHDGKYSLQADDDRFVVRLASPPRRVISKRSGSFARWVSDSEVAFLDETRRPAKIDVSEPTKTVVGTPVCEAGVSCQPDGPPPTLEWVSRNLQWAVVRGLGNEPFLVRKGQAAPLAAAASGAAGSKMMAFGVGQAGFVCALAVRGTEEPPAEAGLAARVGQLRCAEAPWTGWRQVREFAVEGPLERVDADAQVKFFSEREVLVSLLPGNPDPRKQKFLHCVVTLETAAARCTRNARPDWYSAGDGRWVVERTIIDQSLPRLIDLERKRSWAIGNDRAALYAQPVHDARNPGHLVLQRVDKAEMRAGTVELPTGP